MNNEDFVQEDDEQDAYEDFSKKVVAASLECNHNREELHFGTFEAKAPRDLDVRLL